MLNSRKTGDEALRELHFTQGQLEILSMFTEDLKYEGLIESVAKTHSK